MALGAFITITRPDERGDTYRQCREMAEDLFDKVVIIDGKDSWPQEFDWKIIGKHFQAGYEKLDTDWVFHLDCDFFFHQKDFAKIRQATNQYSDAPALSFYKWQFIQPGAYNLKSRLVLAVNKAKYGDRIRFDSGGDLCQPSLDGSEIKNDEIPAADVAFYNYEHLLKTREQTKDDVARMDRAYQRHFGKWVYSTDGSEDGAFEGWLQMVKGRYAKPQQKLPLDQHPKYIQETIKNLKPENFGYNGWGELC